MWNSLPVTNFDILQKKISRNLLIQCLQLIHSLRLLKSTFLSIFFIWMKLSPCIACNFASLFLFHTSLHRNLVMIRTFLYKKENKYEIMYPFCSILKLNSHKTFNFIFEGTLKGKVLNSVHFWEKKSWILSRKGRKVRNDLFSTRDNLDTVSSIFNVKHELLWFFFCSFLWKLLELVALYRTMCENIIGCKFDFASDNNSWKKNRDYFIFSRNLT